MSGLRLLPFGDRFPDTVAVEVDSHEGPSVDPTDGIHMSDPAVGLVVLEVKEPPGSVRSGNLLVVGRDVDEGALVGPVDLRGALLEDDLLLVGTEDVAGAVDDLPADLDTPSRSQDVVPAVELMELRPLEIGMMGSVDDLLVTRKEALGIRGHRTEMKDLLLTRAGEGVGVDQVGLAVIVPEKAGIDPSTALDQAPRLAPLAARIVGGRDIDPLLHHRENNPVLPAMVADCRSPDA